MNKQLLFLLTFLVSASVGAQMTESTDELSNAEDSSLVQASADIVSTDNAEQKDIPSASDSTVNDEPEVVDQAVPDEDVSEVSNEQSTPEDNEQSDEPEGDMLPSIAMTANIGPIEENNLTNQKIVAEGSEPAETASSQEENQQESSSAEVVQEQPSAQEPEVGIDTLDQEGGNWLLKRVSLEKMVDLIEKINMLFTTILESRMDYLVKRNKVDRDFDVFAQQIDFELGDLDQLLEALINKIDAERTVHGDLEEQERDLESDVIARRDDLKALQDVVKSIADMDSTLDDVVMQIEQEVNKSNNYQVQAWNNFQKIKQILSDEKAEELYAQTEGMYRNLQDIQNYLKNDLNNYFNTVVNDITTGIQDAQEKIKALQTQGTDLKKEAEQLTHTEQPPTAQEQEAPVVVPQKATHWYDYFTYLWHWISNTVKGWWHSLLSLFGKQETIKVRNPQPVAQPSGQTGDTTAAESEPTKTE